MAEIDIDTLGTIRYYDDSGYRHREDGPAVISSNGIKRWCINDRRHRDVGPAIEHPSGYKRWVHIGVTQWPKLA